MLAQLRADHRGSTHACYLDVPFAEILARPATKPIADKVSQTQLRDWCRQRDLLPGGEVRGLPPVLRWMQRLREDTRYQPAENPSVSPSRDARSTRTFPSRMSNSLSRPV